MERVLGLFFSSFILSYCAWACGCLGNQPAISRGNVASFTRQESHPNVPRTSEQAASQRHEEPRPLQRRSKVRVEIVAIGDELCYGKVYDTNSFWIADQVTRRGGFVERIVCVRDNVSDIASVLKDALHRKPRFIFITGGLGPTADDKTREALSAATGRRIVRRPDILEFIARRRNVPVGDLPPHFAISTSSLEGAKCFPNPAGVSPVTIIDQGPTEIIALPGPPWEVYACFAARLSQMVQKVTGYNSTSMRVIIPMYESELTPLMTKVMREIPGTYLKALVGEYTRDSGMPVEVMAFGATEELCRETCDTAVEKLRLLAAEKGRKMIEVPQREK